MSGTKLFRSLSGPRGKSARAPMSIVRYGIAFLIIATIGYASLHIVPLIYHDLLLLQSVSTVDVQGLRLEGDLQRETQADRRAFLRVLLAAGQPSAQATELASMQDYDAQVADTSQHLNELDRNSRRGQAAFEQEWQKYLALRKSMLQAVQLRGIAGAKSVDGDLGRTADRQVEQSLQIAAQSYQDSSSAHIQAVSQALEGALKELLVLVALKILVLGLIVWMDGRRVRAERKLEQAARDLRGSEERFHRAYECASVGMGMFKRDGTVVSANQKAAEMLGCGVSDLIGTKVKDFMAPECREDHLSRIANPAGNENHHYQSERRVIRRDGTYAWVRNSVTLLEMDGEEFYFSISEDVTHQKQANERLAFLANYDPVTNLPNRHHFEELLTQALHPTAGFSTCTALLYLEVDSFDFLKGTFGRSVAEEVLGEIGASLAEFRREGEVIARLDDHVFVLMFPAAEYDENSLIRGGELRDLFNHASETSKHRIPLSASIGIAFSKQNDGRIQQGKSLPEESGTASADAEKLLKFARAAMLEARSRGGDSIYLADPALQERAVQRHRIELALLRGLREDEFRVVFQPQFEIATGRLVRFEALCRWTSSELGVIPPDRFIPIAEQTGLIMEIGRRVMYEALVQAKKWSDGGRRIGVAVNISPMQFMRPDFTQIVTEVLAATQFPAELLELEITEGIFIRDLNLAVARIRELQRLGVSIALDDFGTGYSSLSYLQRMPIDAVKLDRSFVNDLTTDPATVSMVRSVLAMAEALHLRVVTEGVETEQQLNILRELGCQEAQGYLLGRPESAESALLRVQESPFDSIENVA